MNDRALPDCPVCANAYLAIRTDIYKDKREFVYCDCCGAMATVPLWTAAQSPEIARLRELAATCYAGLGAECNLPEPWLKALSAAANGEPFSTDGLLPFDADIDDVEEAKRIDRAAKVLAECMDYPWDHMPEQGRDQMRLHAKAVIAASTKEAP